MAGPELITGFSPDDPLNDRRLQRAAAATLALLTAARIFPQTAAPIARYGFGVVLSDTGAVTGLTALSVTNALPQPFGFVPPEVYGLEPDFYLTPGLAKVLPEFIPGVSEFNAKNQPGPSAPPPFSAEEQAEVKRVLEVFGTERLQDFQRQARSGRTQFGIRNTELFAQAIQFELMMRTAQEDAANAQIEARRKVQTVNDDVYNAIYAALVQRNNDERLAAAVALRFGSYLVPGSPQLRALATAANVAAGYGPNNPAPQSPPVVYDALVAALTALSAKQLQSANVGLFVLERIGTLNPVVSATASAARLATTNQQLGALAVPFGGSVPFAGAGAPARPGRLPGGFVELPALPGVIGAPGAPPVLPGYHQGVPPDPNPPADPNGGFPSGPKKPRPTPAGPTFDDLYTALVHDP
jgi:hypothetical protein